jgi:hypothetical protein
MPILKKLVHPDRLTSEYSNAKIASTYKQAKKNQQGKYKAINIQSYEGLRTLEVRLHHGSINKKEILMWVKLLLTVVDDKPVTKELYSWIKSRSKFWERVDKSA